MAGIGKLPAMGTASYHQAIETTRAVLANMTGDGESADAVAAFEADQLAAFLGRSV